MNEIEKMYENVLGIKKECLSPYVDPEYCAKDCKECKDFGYDYPPFTADKQIELIKLLGSIRDYTVEIDKFKGVYYVGCREAESNNKHWGSRNIFEEALAELVNDLWQDLTEEEKQQVKGILE